MNAPPPQPVKPGDAPRTLYASSPKVYPREVKGLFTRLRHTAVVVLLGLFYGLPWLNWGDRQAILLDLPGRKFHLFGLTLWPQDLIFLALLLAFAGFTLFLFTALAGRLWCGYACPQTVWTEVFVILERWVEGDRSAQMKLDRAPMSARKLRIKVTKHTVWLLFALYTGFTFVGFFSPIRELIPRAMSLSTSPWETFWVLFYGFATYGNAGWLREQVCKYMCPYARFQSAMFDKDTMVVSYDRARGEPRGSRSHGADARAAGLGDCINCTLCVQVCPTGIDIRDGLQYECIGCSACIDVCNNVMDKMGYPRGLVRYTTEHALEGRRTKVLRPRVFIYAGIWLAAATAIVLGVANRSILDVEIMRDRNQLFRETNEGLIENVYTLHILNRDNVTHSYRIEAEGIPGMRLRVEKADTTLPSGAEVRVPVSIAVDPEALEERSTPVTFTVSAENDESVRFVGTGRFLGPER